MLGFFSLIFFPSQVVTNLAAFCACAGMGQLFVFFIIKEFGSLVNVTVTISRKFFRCGAVLALRHAYFCVFNRNIPVFRTDAARCA